MLAKRVSPSGVSILQKINLFIFGDALIKLDFQQRFVLFEFLFDPVVSTTQAHIAKSILDITDDDWINVMHGEKSHESDKS